MEFPIFGEYPEVAVAEARGELFDLLESMLEDARVAQQVQAWLPVLGKGSVGAGVVDELPRKVAFANTR